MNLCLNGRDSTTLRRNSKIVNSSAANSPGESHLKFTGSGLDKIAHNNLENAEQGLYNLIFYQPKV